MVNMLGNDMPEDHEKWIDGWPWMDVFKVVFQPNGEKVVYKSIGSTMLRGICGSGPIDVVRNCSRTK
jgi:hypothetical protein